MNSLMDSTKANEEGSEQTSNSLNIVAGKANEQLTLVRDNLDLIEANSEQMANVEASMQSIQSLLDVAVTDCREGIEQLE